MNAVKVSGMACDHCDTEATIRVDSDAPIARRMGVASSRSLWLCPHHAAATQRALAIALHPAGSDA